VSVISQIASRGNSGSGRRGAWDFVLLDVGPQRMGETMRRLHDDAQIGSDVTSFWLRGPGPPVTPLSPQSSGAGDRDHASGQQPWLQPASNSGWENRPEAGVHWCVAGVQQGELITPLRPQRTEPAHAP